MQTSSEKSKKFNWSALWRQIPLYFSSRLSVYICICTYVYMYAIAKRNTWFFQPALILVSPVFIFNTQNISVVDSKL